MRPRTMTPPMIRAMAPKTAARVRVKPTVRRWLGVRKAESGAEGVGSSDMGTTMR